MSIAVPSRHGERVPSAASSARRSRPPREAGIALVALLLVLAGAAWWSTADRMAGMDAGPGTDLGTLGWFLGVWVVMMAAMMFPSLAPTAALYARMTRAARRGSAAAVRRQLPVGLGRGGPGRLRPVRARPSALGGALAWDAGGRWVAGWRPRPCRRLRAHAAQERVPGQVPQPARVPARTLARRPPRRARDGRRHAGWCMGCCWGLMVALFALGVMSVTWMAVVAALIALEKTRPMAADGHLGHGGAAARARGGGGGRASRCARAGRARVGQRDARHGRDAVAVLAGS